MGLVLVAHKLNPMSQKILPIVAMEVIMPLPQNQNKFLVSLQILYVLQGSIFQQVLKLRIVLMLAQVIIQLGEVLFMNNLKVMI